MLQADAERASGHQAASLLLHRLRDALGLGRGEERARERKDHALLLLDMMLDLFLQLAQLGDELVALAIEIVELLEQLFDIDMLLQRLLDPIADLGQVAEGGIEGVLLGLLMDRQLALERSEQSSALRSGDLEGVEEAEEVGDSLMILLDQRINIQGRLLG